MTVGLATVWGFADREGVAESANADTCEDERFIAG